RATIEVLGHSPCTGGLCGPGDFTAAAPRPLAGAAARASVARGRECAGAAAVMVAPRPWAGSGLSRVAAMGRSPSLISVQALGKCAVRR
ncbi:MAG TPA: hypothetical protein VHL09_15005, partial [Dehalococcoidia bacterium]|nr:hypothetical protein [Dehalococcoidia bacterium]